MALLDDLKNSGGKPPPRPPKQWRPHSDVDTEQGGYVVSKPFDAGHEPEHGDVLEEFGLTPDLWRVTSVRRGRWQTYDERWLESVRINIEPVHQVAKAQADAEKIVEQISKWRPRKPKRVESDVTFHAPVGDTQIGKIDGGGSEQSVNRFLDELGQVVERQRSVKAGTVHLPWLGDCIEGVVSQGGKVAGRLDLTLTQQVRVVRRLAMAQIKAFAPLTDKVVVATVPGNHDEPTRDLLTQADDSWAVDAISAVADGVAENPELSGRVEFLFPHPDTLTIVDQYSGVTVALAHGHQFGRGVDGALKWWDQQASGRTPAGDADLLLSAHLHHLTVKDHGGSRLWIQIPALDGGSNWFTERHGSQAPSRMVSFVTEGGRVRALDPVI